LIDPDGRDTAVRHLQEVKIVDSKPKHTNVFPLILPRVFSPRPFPWPKVEAIPAPNPWLLLAGLLLSPMNYGHSGEKDREDQLLKLTINDILLDAKWTGKTGGTNGNPGADIYEKPGGMDQADKDFDALNPSGVRPIPGGRVGTLPNGDKINVRDKSSPPKKWPTLEVQNPDGVSETKIRYDPNN